MNLDNMLVYIDIVNNASGVLTFNTLENLYHKLDTITPEKLLEFRNLNSVLLNAEKIKDENVKNMIINDLRNKAETLVSQL